MRRSILKGSARLVRAFECVFFIVMLVLLTGTRPALAQTLQALGKIVAGTVRLMDEPTVGARRPESLAPSL